jgi:hypothetical protein
VVKFGEGSFLMAGLMATLEEGFFCGGIGGYVGRMAFL